MERHMDQPKVDFAPVACPLDEASACLPGAAFWDGTAAPKNFMFDTGSSGGDSTLGTKYTGKLIAAVTDLAPTALSG